MHEQIKQVIDHIAQFATDLNILRTELLLEGEFDIYAELPALLGSLSDDLIDRYHTLRELAGDVEEEHFNTLSLIEDEGVVEEVVNHFYGEDDGGFDVIEAIEHDERSLTEFANDAGLGRATVQRFMTGNVRPRAKTLRGIEKALGLKEGSLDE